MTLQEREEFYKNSILKVRQRLFKIGQPFVFEKEGTILAEYADGTIKVVR